MKKTALAGVLAASSVLIFAAVTCDNGNDPPRMITLLSPTGGAGVQYTVNDTMAISWTVHNDNADSAKVQSLAISGSTDGGAHFYGIVTISVPADTPVWNGSYSWPITNGWESTQFVLKLYDYSGNSPAFDQSQPFVINP